MPELETPQQKINVELLQETLAYIKAHPKEWDQTEWFCGTSACFAGWAAVLAGHKRMGRHTFSVMNPETGRRGYVWNVATRELGLTDTQASELFAGGNDFYALEQVVGRLTDLAQNADSASWCNTQDG